MSHSSDEPHHQQGENSIDQVQSKQQSDIKKMPDYDQQEYWQNYSPRGPYANQPLSQIPGFNLSHDRNFDDFEHQKWPIHPTEKGKSNHYPFRKHSIGDAQQQVEPVSPHEDPHKMPMQMPFGYYPYHQPPQKYQPQSQTQHMQYKSLPPNTPYMYPPQWCRPQFQGQQGMYTPYNFGMQFPDQQQYQNTVSKELQSKVYQIIQQTQVSSFQCNCKKSKCLKLYCECFALGQVCSQSCNCQDCKNRIDNQQERSKAIEEALLRNNDAFHQVLQGKPSTFPMQSVQESKPLKEVIKETTIGVKKGGCNCQKSNCKKKYCECFRINQLCDRTLCKCQNCQNNQESFSQGKDKQQAKILQDFADESPVKEKDVIDINIKHKSKKIKKEENRPQQVQVELKIYNNSSGKKKTRQTDI